MESSLPKPLYDAILISPDDGRIMPSGDNMEVVGVFNPGVTYYDGKFHFLLRISERIIERRQHEIASPVINREADSLVLKPEWYFKAQLSGDGRAIVLADGTERLPDISHFRYATSKDGKVIDYVDPEPTIWPQPGRFAYEEYGIEDACIAQIRVDGIEGIVHDVVGIDVKRGDTLFFITYVTGSDIGNVSTGLLVTQDFRSFIRAPYRNPSRPILEGAKDMTFFNALFPSPSTSGMYFAAVTRPWKQGGFRKPTAIHISFSPDFVSWGQHHLVVDSDRNDDNHVGGKPAPIRLSDVSDESGWLCFFHEVSPLFLHHPWASHQDAKRKAYLPAMFTLDEERPWILTGRSPPFARIDTVFRKKGCVPFVRFTSGAEVVGDDVFLFEGSADTVTSVTKYKLEDLLRFHFDHNFI